MKKFQSYEQFEAELKKERIPDIDLQKVKARISEINECKQTIRNKRKIIVVIAAVILVMCFGTVVMAFNNGWQLMNKKGEVVYNYSKMENIELFKWRDATEREREYGLVKEELQESLTLGEMAYILVTESYEMDKFFSILQVEEEKIYDLEKLRKSTITKFMVPQYLPDSYRFEYGKVTFKEQGDKEKVGEVLYKAAKKEGHDYIIKKEKLTKEAKYITLRYVNDDEYRLTIRIAYGDSGKSLDYEIETIEKFIASGKEILYMKHYWYNTDSYLFVDEDSPEKLTYYITNKATSEERFDMDSEKECIELTKTEAAKMIESFK